MEKIIEIKDVSMRFRMANDKLSSIKEYVVQLISGKLKYEEFDIEVKNKDGEVQRLSRTIDKQSGGETQTPFYIAVLASFAQLYRMGRDKKANTARLVEKFWLFRPSLPPRAILRAMQ